MTMHAVMLKVHALDHISLEMILENTDEILH